MIERDVQFSVSPHAKAWVIKKLVEPLQRRERELDELIAAFDRDGVELVDTDELHGTYTGHVLAITSNFVAQLNKTTHQVAIHDRLMLDTGRRGPGSTAPGYVLNEDLTIRYSAADAPRIERYGIVRE